MSVTDKGNRCCDGENEVDARARQQAALELFRERGYDRTAAAEIASRAGVTERTFFRHFPTNERSCSMAKLGCEQP